MPSDHDLLVRLDERMQTLSERVGELTAKVEGLTRQPRIPQKVWVAVAALLASVATYFGALAYTAQAHATQKPSQEVRP